MNQFSQDELDHQQKLWLMFQRPEYNEFIKELETYRKDLINYMARLDITLKEHEIEHIKGKAKIELLDLWLSMPEQTKSLLEQLKDFITIS